MRYTKVTILFVSLILLQLSVYAKDINKVQAGIAQQQILEQTDIKTVNGEIIHIDRTKNGLIFKGYEDKIVLLEVFGHSCPPCKASIPGYNRLQKKYQKDVLVIAIEGWGSDNAGLKQYAHTHNIHYKAVSTADSGKIIPFIGKLTGWNLNMGVPYLMLFSRGGVLAKDVPPQGLPEEHVNGMIQQLLK